jgi:hypothetical protein
VEIIPMPSPYEFFTYPDPDGGRIILRTKFIIGWSHKHRNRLILYTVDGSIHTIPLSEYASTLDFLESAFGWRP